MTVLDVRNFAQIESAKIQFGDLTVLVGPQAIGKSLILQWLKVAMDIGEILPSLKEAGNDVGSAASRLDLIFGEGMSNSWRAGSSSVTFNGTAIEPDKWKVGAKRKKTGKVFYIPAHRALLLAEGWPAPFLKLNADTPVVARLFSQNLYQRFSGRQAASLFPVDRILKEQYRELIDKAVFHGGRVELEKDKLRYRLRLTYGDKTQLPFMAWTAGQREFTPMLLGLYQVLPARNRKKLPGVDWIVIEEPEMGLHPKAISIVMLLVLELLWRGYKVVISTHAPFVLDTIWAIRRLSEHKSRWQLLADAFDVRPAPMQKVLEHALKCDYRVHFLDFNETNGRVRSRDISRLDPDSDAMHEADWGGLTGFSSRFGEAVRRGVNEVESR